MYKLLDLFCGAGGAAMGYHQAGFDVVGVDIRPQPHYPFEFHQADALEYCTEHGAEYDVIHASPPCQAYTKAQKLHGYKHPDMIAPTRAALKATGRPYVIENVPGAPLIDPIGLQGTMFGLQTVRLRLFESNVPLAFILAPVPGMRHAKMGRLAAPGEYHYVCGKGGPSGIKTQWERAMGIDWMTLRELAQAIPPAYTRSIGEQLMMYLAS